MGEHGVQAHCGVYAANDKVIALAGLEGPEGPDYGICLACKAAVLIAVPDSPDPVTLVDLLCLQSRYVLDAGDTKGAAFEEQRQALASEIAALRQLATRIYRRYVPGDGTS
jgi:hypothetical protein